MATCSIVRAMSGAAGLLLAALLSVAPASAAPAEGSPLLCFDDVMAAQWGSNERNARANALLTCAQAGAATLAVLDAVDRGAVAPSAAGPTARQLAFEVMSESRRAVEGRAFAAGGTAPTPNQLRDYIGDDIEVLGGNRKQLAALVDGAWSDPDLARTRYPKATKAMVDEWADRYQGKESMTTGRR